MRVGARAQKAGVALTVFARTLAEEVDDLRLRHLPRNIKVPLQAVFRGNRCKEFIDRIQANRFQHGFAVGGRFG